MYFTDIHGNKFSCDFNFIGCKSIVISGGAFKCVYAIGALSRINDETKLKLQNFIGTSSGSVICTLLSIGFSPIEIIQYLFGINDKYPPLRNIRDFAIEKIEEMFSYKGFDKNLTFIDHYLLTNNNLFVVATNVSKGCEEIFSWKNTPKTKISTAIRLSCSLPFIFPFCYYNNSMFIDGIFADNFPLKITEKIRKKGKVIGISTRNSYIPNNIVQFYCKPKIYKIVYIPDKVGKYFTVSKEDIFCMYMIGYNFIDNNIKKNKMKKNKKLFKSAENII